MLPLATSIVAACKGVTSHCDEKMPQGAVQGVIRISEVFCEPAVDRNNEGAMPVWLMDSADSSQRVITTSTTAAAVRAIIFTGTRLRCQDCAWAGPRGRRTAVWNSVNV